MTSTGESDADRLRREAGASYQETKTQTSGMANEAKTRMQEAGEQAKAEASGITERAKERISAEASAQKDQVAGRIAGVADRAHQVADDLRADEAWLANAIDSGARYLDDFAGAVRTRDFPGLMHEVEELARRQPGVFMGATVALGFMLGRFVRSSGSPSRSGFGSSGGYAGYDDPRYRGYARHDYEAESGYRDASRDWRRYGSDQDPLRGGYASSGVGTGGPSGMGSVSGGGTAVPASTGYAGTAASPSSSSYARSDPMGSAATPGTTTGKNQASSPNPVGTTGTRGTASGTGTTITNKPEENT